MCHKSVERMRTTVRITRLYRSFHRFGIQDRSSNWEVYKKKKEEKRKIWNTNNLTNMYLRILWCRTGCESARQQSTYNLKREQFFFILLTICTIGTMMNQYLSFFSFLSNFCWTLFKWKKWSLVNRNYYWRQSC